MGGLDFDPGFDHNEWEDRKDYYKPQTIGEQHDGKAIKRKIVRGGDNRRAVVLILKTIGVLIVVAGVLLATLLIVKAFQFAFM